MTHLLKEAFEQASKLPAAEQDALALAILEELESEARWAGAFDGVEDVLTRLADEALSEHQTGETKPLDPERL